MVEDRIVATAEAAWPAKKCALINSNMVEEAEVFRQAEWTVYLFDESGLSAPLLDALMASLGEQS